MRQVDLTDELLNYVAASANPHEDEVAEKLAATTRQRFPDLAHMNIGADHGGLLAMLVAITGAREVVEVGTFTGMSALWMARALPDGGRVICFDITDEYLDIAQGAWTAAGVLDRIDFRQGPAADGLAALPEEPHIDMAFVDADKVGYQTYVELLLPRMVERGVIIVDNVMWKGRVLDHDDATESTVAIREFNDWVANHPIMTAVMLPLGDGVTLIRRRSS